MGKPNDKLKIQKAIMDLRGYIKKFPKEELWASELLLACGYVLSYDQITTFFLNEIDDKFNDPKTFPTNYVEKIIYCLSAVMGREGLTKTIFDPENIHRIRMLKESYETFIKENNIEKHEGIYNLLLNIQALLAERPMRVGDFEEELEIEELDEEPIDYQTKIKELEIANEELRKQKIALERAVEKREKTNQTLQEEALSRQTELRKQVQEANSEISRLKKENQKEQEEWQIKYSEAMLEKEQEKNHFRDLIQSKNELLNELQKNEMIREKHQIELNQAKEMILQSLYQPISTKDLAKRIKSEKIQISELEIQQLIHTLCSDFNISTTKIDYPKKYKITPPEVATNQTFTLNYKGESCDILLISDQHNMNDFAKFQKNMDIIYNYAAANDIDYIFDLGDFFGATRITGNHFEELQKWQRIIEEISNRIPNSKTPYGILGGNHDRYLLNLGIDPLKQLEMRQENIFSLGYDHTILSFANSLSEWRFFMLHHDYFQNYEEDFYVMHTMLNNIQEYYKSIKLDRELSFIDFFGHYHRSLLNQELQIASIPSLNVYQNRRGAWHVKIYLNEQRKIQYMIINPMILIQGKFEGMNEIVYKRTKH